MDMLNNGNDMIRKGVEPRLGKRPRGYTLLTLGVRKIPNTHAQRDLPGSEMEGVPGHNKSK